MSSKRLAPPGAVHLKALRPEKIEKDSGCIGRLHAERNLHLEHHLHVHAPAQSGFVVGCPSLMGHCSTHQMCGTVHLGHPLSDVALLVALNFAKSTACQSRRQMHSLGQMSDSIHRQNGRWQPQLHEQKKPWLSHHQGLFHDLGQHCQPGIVKCRAQPQDERHPLQLAIH